MSVILDVPISGDSTNNQLSNTTGVGTFGYSGYSKIPTNSTQYHSYFFNATSSTGSYIRNATSVVINLTGWASSQDIDLFLFDNSGNLKTKSINKNTSEHIVYSYLPSSNQMWEIRLYGNSTNTSGIPYYGYIIFNTLNMTNASDTNRQISLINFTSAFVNGFGAETAMNVSNTSRINVTLKNEGRINLTNTAESIDLYNIQRFALSGSQNMSFIVPNSTVASKLKVILNWTGDSNYSFDVYNPSGTLVMSSKNKHNYANMTGAMQEEYNETTSIGNGGFWRVQVTNNTNVTNAVYTLAALIYITPSNWITSNFSTFNFNSTGETNSTYTIQYNLTVPNDTIYGKYEGHVQYRSSSGSILRVPIEVSANTASLIVNNSFQSSSITLNENINTTLTRTMNITYNNKGNLPISISHSNSSGILNPSSSNKNISFTYVVPSTIAANSSGTINVTININTANTGDTQGNYDGWIFLIANESRPSSNFNLSLRVALSNTLTITFLGVKTNADTNTTRSTSIENVTFGFDVTYINGTALESPSALNYSNISSISLSNINISNTISLGNISNYSTTTPIYCTSGCDGWFGNNHYYVNATVPPNSIGGTYDMSLTASYQRTGTTFSGTGLGSTTGKYLVVNNSGLYMGYTNSSSFSLQPTNVTRFYVNVTNYGPVDSNASLNSINFTESCADYSISGADTNAYGTGCSISSYSPTANTYNITVPANGTTCIFWWTITAASTGNASTCTAYTKASGTFFNPDGLSVPIIVSSTSSSTTTTTTAGTATTTTTTSNMEFTSYESLVIVQQNSSNYTDVGIKNTGSKTLDVTFSIDGMNSTWYALNDTNELLVQGARAGFREAFNIGLEDVKDYSVSYKATSATKTITQNFTFRITPAPATQVIINTTLDQHKLNMTQLEYEINQSKSKNVNVSLAEQKLAELKAKIAEAEKYIAQGDYFNANQLLATIKNLIEETKNELSKAKEIESEGKFKRIWLYVGIGVGVIILVGAGYLFWPTKSKSSQGFSLKSLKPSEKEKDFEKLKEKYKRNSE